MKIDEEYIDQEIGVDETATDETSIVTTPEDSPRKMLLGELIEEEETTAETELDIDQEDIRLDINTEESEDSDEEDDDEESVSDSEEESETTAQPARRSGSKKRSPWYWLTGAFFEHPLFRRNIPLLIVLLLMGIIHVWSNYRMIDKQQRVERLERAIQDMTYKRMGAVGDLTRKSFGTNLEQQIKSRGSELRAPQVPPIVIYREEGKDDN